ncbi:hypothetical protein CJ030_MR5G025002 [Morella rubra]|uniref:Uncharacterized protein n=1 Tax=Morella rubra TaxID=262757 RepID=A0A6A1VHN0_9ROSI|nr:hypothetical protein CJ030_MR5G025002 [Morella rubra]
MTAREYRSLFRVNPRPLNSIPPQQPQLPEVREGTQEPPPPQRNDQPGPSRRRHSVWWTDSSESQKVTTPVGVIRQIDRKQSLVGRIRVSSEEDPEEDPMEEDPSPKIVGNECNEKSSSWREDTWEGIRRVLGRGPSILYDSPENSSQEVDFVPKYHEPSGNVIHDPSTTGRSYESMSHSWAGSNSPDHVYHGEVSSGASSNTRPHPYGPRPPPPPGQNFW